MWMLILLTLLSAICYRAGGWGQEGRDKYPNLPGWLFDTKARDLMGGFCTIGAFFVLGLHKGITPWKVAVACLATIPATLGALSTYWDEVFGFDNFWAHGFVIGLASFPLAIITGSWIGFGIRCFVLAVFMGGWCAIFSNDVVEEGGRGAIIPPTMWLFKI